MWTHGTGETHAPLLGEHAVVVGGGIAGLLCARVLAERFERVTVIERDALGPSPAARPGVAQDRHVNVLLAAALRELDRWFPQLVSELERRGSVAYDPGSQAREESAHGPAVATPLGARVQSLTRPLLEAGLRAQLVSLPAVKLRAEARVTGLLWRRARVCGVRICLSRGTITELAADLVVDAAGAAGVSCSWLAEARFAQPEASCIRSSAHHTTRAFVMPEGIEREWQALQVCSDAPLVPRAGVLVPVEGRRWLVRLSSYGEEAPPADLPGFIEFARSLVHPALHDAIRDAEPIGTAIGSAFPASVRRHFELLPRVPEGLLVIGDSLCAVDPVYAQGCSVAALQARALEKLLADRTRAGECTLDGLARDFFRLAAQVIDRAWRPLLLCSLAFPHAELSGPCADAPKDWKLSLRQLEGVRAAAVSDVATRRRWLEVVHLLRSFEALFDDEADAATPFAH